MSVFQTKSSIVKIYEKNKSSAGSRLISDQPIFILAGGFGSRLKSVVHNVPKPLAPVNENPFLFYLIDNLIKQGGRKFIFLLHYVQR